MEEDTQYVWHIMLYYFKKGKNTTEMQKKDLFCVLRRWFAAFRAGDFSLDAAPRSGRPGEVDRDQIQTVIENKQHSTTRERAHVLKKSKSIKLLVKMKNVFIILWKKLHGLLGQPNNTLL